MKKTALITGGTRGIGLGIAKSLAAEGWNLALCGVREEDAVLEALGEVKDAGAASVLYVPADISDADARENLVRSVLEEYGSIHCLVNNAGVAPNVRADVLEASEESFDRLMNINLKGPYFLTQLVANVMRRQRGEDLASFRESIIFVGSISATVVSVNRGDYCLSKAGIGMASQLFAARLGEYGIPVYEVRPGVIRTDMTAGVTEKYDTLIGDGLCVQPRWGTPEDVGKVAAALARGDFPYSTGETFHVDGGLIMPRL